MKKHTLLLSSIVVLITGCSTVKSVPPVEIGDSKMSCSDIVLQLEKVKGVKAQASSDQGLSGKNVAAALLFWPAVIGNEMNSRGALQAANERIGNLNKLYNDKNCK